MIDANRKESLEIDVVNDTLIPLVGPEFHGQKSVAQRFDVSGETVNKWRRTKRLKARKVGQRWFTNATCLNHFSVGNDDGDESSKPAKRRRKSQRQRTHEAAVAEYERRYGRTEMLPEAG